MKPLVRVILGSKSDIKHGEKIKNYLEKLEVPYDFYISSAHRKPNQTANLSKNARKDGIKVIIAGAGMAAHLPGVLASHTTLPVIGVPLVSQALDGVDALYSCVQMPSGVPVATVAINGAKNSAILATQILATFDEKYQEILREFKLELAQA